jgi:sulfofructose kinase
LPHTPIVDLVGLGLNATDTLISVAQIPDPGSKADVRRISVLPGGQVATAIVAGQRWGMQTRYVGTLGDDPAAATHHQEFVKAGVETHISTIPNCASAQSFIVVDGQGERTVLWHRDPRLAFAPSHLDREWIINARALLVDGCDTAAATQAAQWARVQGIPVIADLDQCYSNLDPLLEEIDYLIVSSHFPAQLSGRSELRESLPWLQRRYRSRLTAATLGRDGVLAWGGDQFCYSAAYRVPVADTIGAGDIFHAGFIYGLLHNWPLQRNLDFACAAAALNCMAAGARGGIQPVDKIQALMAGGERYPAAYDVAGQSMP